MAYIPTDNSPRLFPEHGPHHQQPEENVEEDPPQEVPESPETPDSQDGFASMIAETLRDLSSGQRLFAQREIMRVLHRARYVGGDTSQSSRDAETSGPAGRVSEPGGQRARGSRYSTAAAGFLTDRFGVAHTPPQCNDEEVQDIDDDSFDIEWGFTPENSIGP